MTLTDAAAAAGISLDAFNRILSGERVPHVNTLVALSKTFHVSLADLLDEQVELSAPARLAASLISEQSPDVQNGAVQVLRTFFEVVARYRDR